jgi:hypothetical protein
MLSYTCAWRVHSPMNLTASSASWEQHQQSKDIEPRISHRGRAATKCRRSMVKGLKG